jgi:hypothetical protein
MAGPAGVDYCQTAMTQTDAAARIVKRGRRPNTFIVATTMLDGLQHPGQVPFRIETD